MEMKYSDVGDYKYGIEEYFENILFMLNVEKTLIQQIF